MHKISDDLATISMISDERTMIFFLGIIVTASSAPFSVQCRHINGHREMSKVGMVNRLLMHIVHKFVEFPPPLITLHLPLFGIHNLDSEVPGF